MLHENCEIKVGDKVRPITPAGLELADRRNTGAYEEKRNRACVLRGTGTVLEIHDVEIDYDSWPDSKDHGLGKIMIRECLIQCKEGTGWGSGVYKVPTPD